MYIGKVAELTGTTVKCIRHYESIGLLPTPRREGKYRIYSGETVELLSMIKCAQQLGFKLKEMQVILSGNYGSEDPKELARNAIAHKKEEINSQLQLLQSTYRGLVELEKSLDEADEICDFKWLKKQTNDGN